MTSTQFSFDLPNLSAVLGIAFLPLVLLIL
ncbi:MAG: hypothetical protein JWN93_1926 [Hyphomicrobiales bacterium]|nr:hypothetical protein [Hyphomicrobiales bacterium]